ncbi:bifunctional 5,10-methylenetetrahydrofolate dehydrogenase/5,10-methenyltetrahydrofolate cyclohydrolase [Patescibacteria group bacterium]
MVIDGKKIAQRKLSKLKSEVKKKNLNLQLDILYIGKNTSSEIFIRNKIASAEKAGIKVKVHTFPTKVSEDTIRATCNNLNLDPNCTGYFFQLPIAKHLDEEKMVDLIAEEKDVDCLTSKNLGKILFEKGDSLKPAPVEAILSILRYLNVRLKSKVITIINDSNLIGKPLTTHLLTKDATVIVCNSSTKNLSQFTRKADIIITAAGKVNLITKTMIKKNSIVIDAGITRKDGKVVGDTDFENVSKVAKAITPVPGGVGPLTVICLLENVLKIYKKNNE